MTVRKFLVAVLEAFLLAFLLTGSSQFMPEPEEKDLFAMMEAFESDPQTESDAAPWNENRLIAHALGQVDGTAYLNCREGFEKAYKRGCRLFEVDLTRTSDGYWVCRHSWQDSLGQWEEEHSGKLTLKEFKENLLMGKYVPMTWQDLVLLAGDYPDAYFILDTKHYSFRNNLSTIRDYTDLLSLAKETGGSQTMDRFVPEIYNEAMLSAVASVYPFSACMYSLWKEYSDEELEEIASFCEDRGIKAAAVSGAYWTPELESVFDSRNIFVYVYTVNEPAEAQAYISKGAHGIVSDLPDGSL